MTTDPEVADELTREAERLGLYDDERLDAAIGSIIDRWLAVDDLSAEGRATVAWHVAHVGDLAREMRDFLAAHPAEVLAFLGYEQVGKVTQYGGGYIDVLAVRALDHYPDVGAPVFAARVAGSRTLRGGDAMSAQCRGFQWIGQDFAHCENCGRDISDHDGMAWGGGMFGAERVIPFDEFMQSSPLFAHYVTPIGGGRPYRWERESVAAGGTS